MLRRPSLRLEVLVGASLAAAALATACGGPPPNAAQSPVVVACPLGVPDTHVEVTDTKEGADVVFVTVRARAPELRLRVASQAARRAPNQHEGPGHEGQHGLGHDHGLKLWTMPPATTSPSVTDLGATIRVAAVDPRDAGELRKRLRARVAELESRECERY